MELYACRCRRCGALSYPARAVCPRCGGREFAPSPLSGRGVLLTWTRLYSLPAGIPGPSRAFGMARLEDGVTVEGLLDCPDPEPGMAVTCAVESVRGTGTEAEYGPVFRRA